MRTVTFKSLLTAVAALNGGQALTDVDAANLALYAEYLTMSLRYAWNWAEWPELQRVRERTPASGLITWAEAGQPTIGSVYGVTLDDPNTVVNPRPVQWRHDVNGAGIRVFNLSSGNVYVRSTRTAPLVTTVAYAGGTTYAVDDLVYDATTGECYEALQAGSGHAVTETDYWRKVDMPFILRNALARGATALRLGAGGQKQTEQLLQNSMDGLLAMEIDQFRNRGGQHQSFAVVNNT